MSTFIAGLISMVKGGGYPMGLAEAHEQAEDRICDDYLVQEVRQFKLLAKLCYRLGSF